MTNHIVSGSEYLSLPRAPEAWLLKPLIPAGGACLLYGDSKVGKSFAAIQLALSLQSGTPWLGFPVVQPGPVVYVQLDTPRSLWAERLEDIRRTGLNTDALLLADRETLGTFPFNILYPEHRALLGASLRPLQPSAVILDTIREAHDGDEDKSTIMRNVIAELVAATAPAALILIAHARKVSAEQPRTDLTGDNRGSSYVVGRMDSIIKFTPRTMHYTGRAVESGQIRCYRDDHGLWHPETSELIAHLETVLADTALTSVLSKAKALSTLTGKSVEACRNILRRAASD